MPPISLGKDQEQFRMPGMLKRGLVCITDAGGGACKNETTTGGNKERPSWKGDEGEKRALPWLDGWITPKKGNLPQKKKVRVAETCGKEGQDSNNTVMNESEEGGDPGKKSGRGVKKK